MSKKLNADLHVHTPKSKDYAHKDEQYEYISLLQSAIDNSMDAIAITDHNSIEGYKNIIKIKRETEQLYQLLRNRTDFEKESLNKVESDLLIFQKLVIFPGIEVSISPGIHYIVIFSHEIELDSIEEWAVANTTSKNSENHYGDESYKVNTTTEAFFDNLTEVFGDNNYILYAPHINSNSGLFKVYREVADARMTVLKDRRLAAVGINSIDEKNYILDNLYPNIKKERQQPISFINDSDFHARVGEKIGSGYILIESDAARLTFDILKKSLIKSKVQTFLDVVQEKYESFKAENKSIISLSIALDAEDDEMWIEHLSKNACAMLNSDNGLIELEINTHGVEDVNEEANKKIDEIMATLQNNLGYAPKRAMTYRFPLSKGKQSLFLRFGKSPNLTLYNNICYIYNSSDSPIAATAHQVESIVAKKLYYKFGKSKDNAALSIAENAHQIHNQLINFAIICNNDDKFSHLPDTKFDFLDISTKTDELRLALEEMPNGHYGGNVAYLCIRDKERIRCGRYSDSYLRATIPTIDAEDECLADTNYKEIKKDTIILVNDGSSHIVTADTKYAFETPCISITSKDIHPYILLGYLRSTFFIWLVRKVYHYPNQFHYILASLSRFIPFITAISQNEKIKTMVHNIITEENNFLRNSIKVEKKKGSMKNCPMAKFIYQHNKKCDSYMVEIDKIIFNSLDIDATEIKRIYTEIFELNIYDFGISNDFETLYLP